MPDSLGCAPTMADWMGKDSYLEFLRKEAKDREIKIPAKSTLRIYGLNERAWLILFREQEWKCPICQKTNAHWNIDHQHISGWKKMPPETRVLFVRGILCWSCNKNDAPSNLSAEKAYRLADYIQKYETRRKKAGI